MSRATADDAAKSEEGSGAPSTRRGSCHCGATRLALTGEPTAVSACHCAICRKLTGAPFSAQALFRPAQVRVHGRASEDEDAPAPVAFASSPNVERFRCPECFSPTHASLSNGKMVAVPLSAIDEEVEEGEAGDAGGGTKEGPVRLRPTHHMYYADRILDVPDDLPKFMRRAGGKDAEMYEPSRRGNG